MLFYSKFNKAIKFNKFKNCATNPRHNYNSSKLFENINSQK